MQSSSNATKTLRWGAAVYAAGLVIHTADHMRRGTGAISSEILTLGMISTTLGVVALALIVTRSRRAPLVATLIGIPTALGVSAVHLLPHWSNALSDAFHGGAAHGVTAVSWLAVMIEIAGALAMGLAGLTILNPKSREP